MRGGGEFACMQCSASGHFAPGATLRVRASGNVQLHIVPAWQDGWELWEMGADSAGRPTVTATADAAGGLVVSVLAAGPAGGSEGEGGGSEGEGGGSEGEGGGSEGTPGRTGGPAGGCSRVAIAIPQMADLDVDAAGAVSVHDKLEAVRALVRSPSGPIRAARLRAEQLWLHCESGDVSVAGVAEGAASLIGRRVFVRRLMAAEASVAADDWAVIQSAFVKQLRVDVGADVGADVVADAEQPGEAEAQAAAEPVAAVLIPSLHGHADITVSAHAARAAAERTGAGGAAVEVAGVTGSVSVSVEPLAAGDATAAPGPAVRCQLDEAAPGSTTRLTTFGGGAGEAAQSQLLLSLPARGRVVAAGSGGVQVDLSRSEAGEGGEVVFEPLEGQGCPEGLLQPGCSGEFRGWPSRNRTTPGVNRGLWPDRDEMLASLRQRAEEQEVQSGGAAGAPSAGSRGLGKIAPDSRATGLFFHEEGGAAEDSGTGDGAPQFEFAGTGAGRVAVESWIGGVRRKAGLRSMAGAARDALRV
ncbi:hypothetical protein FNF28_00343 [Cafeteria roenbergensis]|uniref:Uncharacterized protein n=1 Tax=Cafeteria roenbergensis TaxID=33653 RepID=A0A5A8E2J2_CAFRO|nr:hypothetical protein FNF28_00343 [Cafeteria roenbergensis]